MVCYKNAQSVSQRCKRQGWQKIKKKLNEDLQINQPGVPQVQHLQLLQYIPLDGVISWMNTKQNLHWKSASFFLAKGQERKREPTFSREKTTQRQNEQHSSLNTR